MDEPEHSPDEAKEEVMPARLLTLAALSDWGRTGATVVAIVGAAVTFVRWTATVDDRLGSVESGITGQHETLRQAVEATAQNAGHAVQAAERAEAAVTRAETAVARAETAVAENKSTQDAIVKGTAANRRSIETQGKKVDALKVETLKELQSLQWRIRVLEEESRKA